MAYTKHNFKSGDTLYASQLNEIEEQIALNEEGISGISSVTEPHQQLVTDADGNKKWVDRLGGYSTVEDSILFDYPEGTEQGFSDNDYMHYYSNTPFAGCELVVGETYVVTLAGIPYTTTAKYTETYGIVLGNPAKVQAGDDTGESFVVCMLSYLESAYCLAVTTKFSTIPSLKIVGPLMKYNKIPPEFTESNLFDGEGAFSTRSVNGDSSGELSTALGTSTEASGTASFAIGLGAKSKGNYSVAMGQYTIASGRYQVAMGKHNIEDTENKYAHVVGNGTYDTSSNAHTLDWDGNAWFSGNIKVGGTGQDDAEAKEVIVSQNEKTSHQQLVTDVDGIVKWEEKLCYEEEHDIIFIEETTITGPAGQFFTTSEWPLKEGHSYEVSYNGEIYNCIPFTFNGSLCLGNAKMVNTSLSDTGEPFIITGIAPKIYSYAIFKSNTEHTFSVRGPADIITKIPNKYLSASITAGTGWSANAMNGLPAENASGNMSHAEGSGTASGVVSHAEGFGTAKGAYSHAEGLGTITSSDFQHAQGQYNIEDAENKYAHIVGNGTSNNARSNAHTLDWDGNGWFAGSVESSDLILKSSTEDSTKRFRITVDDTGTLTATEITD